jgi:thioredoxin reductase (NADPH)
MIMTLGQKNFDMAIVGCGPAGLSAAVNAHIRKKSFILLGTSFCSPKMHTSPWIDNYLGEHHILGKDLRDKFLRHIKDIGIEITPKRVDMIYPVEKGYLVQCGDENYHARVVIIASGVDFTRTLKGEEEFLGKGVSYCATCDGPLFQNKTVAMLVYSKDGLDEVKFLAEICQEVILFPLFKGDLFQMPENIIINRVKPIEIGGNDFANRVITDKGTVFVDGVFLFREVVSPGRLVPGMETVNGVIKVNKHMETNLPGLFAAGDCTGKPYQLAKAVGEGQVAALNAVHYLDSQN